MVIIKLNLIINHSILLIISSIIMLDDTEILLSGSTTENKIASAKNLINTYNLPLENYEILEACDKARQCIFKSQYQENNMCDKYKILFRELLSNNINMFIAIIKSRNVIIGNLYVHSYVVMSYYPSSMSIMGCGDISYRWSLDCEVITAYKTLLDYNNFDIDKLIVSEECKTTILEYKNDKYSGKLTKAVVN